MHCCIGPKIKSKISWKQDKFDQNTLLQSWCANSRIFFSSNIPKMRWKLRFSGCRSMILSNFPPKCPIFVIFTTPEIEWNEKSATKHNFLLKNHIFSQKMSFSTPKFGQIRELAIRELANRHPRISASWLYVSLFSRRLWMFSPISRLYYVFKFGSYQTTSCVLRLSLI